MPIEVIDVDEGAGNIIIGRDILTDQEYLDAMLIHLSQAEEKFKKYRYSMLDFSQVSSVEVGLESVRFMAGLCHDAAALNPEIVISMVADDDLAFALSRMWQMLTDKYRPRLRPKSEPASGWQLLVKRKAA